MIFDLGIRAGFLIPMTEMGLIYHDYFIGVSGTKISLVAPFENGHQMRCKKFLDRSEHIVLPGLINAHTHLAMTLFRSIEDDLKLQDWLFQVIFPLEKEFVNNDFVRLGTELAALECTRFGVTTVADMYFHPESALRVWDREGLRGFFPQPLISFPSPESPEGHNDPLFEKFLALNEKYKDHPRLKTGLAPHAPYTCGIELLQKVQRYQEQWGCTVSIHLAETKTEVEDIQKRYQKTPTQHLYDLGLLNNKTILAHVVHTSPSDRTLLRASQAHVVHNPDSNFKLGSGIAPVTDYMEQGIHVALGTDGAASNNTLCMIQAMNLMAKAQKVFADDVSRFKTWMALWAATRGGAKALGWDDQIGQIKEGFEADLIAIALNEPHMHPIDDPVSHMVFCAQGLDVHTTIVAGRVLMSSQAVKGKYVQDVYRRAHNIRSAMRRYLNDMKGSTL
ncbi:MAG: amidohydrolase [Bdellovibrionaceae bacterium]|jgi:5-methylthioadenosine/S-adenosylhomocysteine deaminase|nr:amidohydrolase [Pseudobdellovibrionaceae bacterium]